MSAETLIPKKFADTFPGPHLVEKDGGLAFRKGAWFVSSEEKADQKGREWVVHKLEQGSTDLISSDSDSTYDMYSGNCGRVVITGGFVNTKWEERHGFAIDSPDRVEELSAKFCDKCFPENELENVHSLIDRLEIKRCINMDYDDFNDESLDAAKDSQESIWKMVNKQPDILPFVVKELVYRGIYFEAMTHMYMTDTETFERDDVSDNQIDSLWTSQMMAETIVGIGTKALPYLNDFEDEFSKKLVTKIQAQHIK